MNTNNYPALYISSNEASIKAQNKLLFIHRISILLLLLGVLLAAQTEMLQFFSILSAVVFLSLLFIYIYQRPPNNYPIVYYTSNIIRFTGLFNYYGWYDFIDRSGHHSGNLVYLYLFRSCG